MRSFLIILHLSIMNKTNLKKSGEMFIEHPLHIRWQPGCLLETRGFPSPIHKGFG